MTNLLHTAEILFIIMLWLSLVFTMFMCTIWLAIRATEKRSILYGIASFFVFFMFILLLSGIHP